MSENETLYPKIPNDLILKLVRLSIDEDTGINTLIINAIKTYIQINKRYEFLHISDITNNRVFILADLKTTLSETCSNKVDTFFNSTILDSDEASKLKHVADLPKVLRKLLNMLLTDEILKQLILNSKKATIDNALTDLEGLTGNGLFHYCYSLFSLETNTNDIVSVLNDTTINLLYNYRQELIDAIQPYSIDVEGFSKLIDLVYTILHYDETDKSVEISDEEADNNASALSVDKSNDEVNDINGQATLNPDENNSDTKLNDDNMMSPLLDDDENTIDDSDTPF